MSSLIQYLKLCILIRQPASRAVQGLMNYLLDQKQKTLEDILNEKQHTIYHLYSSNKCCQCSERPKQKAHIFMKDHMKQMYNSDRNAVKSGHKHNKSDPYCCRKANSLTVEQLDISLARNILENIFLIDIFHADLRIKYNQNLELFLNTNSHRIFHLWQKSLICCMCQNDRISKTIERYIDENDFNTLYSKKLNTNSINPCTWIQKNIPCPCVYEVSKGLALESLSESLLSTLLFTLNPLYTALNDIVNVRNSVFHSKEDPPGSDISADDYKQYYHRLKQAVVQIEKITTATFWNEDVTKELQSRIKTGEKIEQMKINSNTETKTVLFDMRDLSQALLELKEEISSSIKRHQQKRPIPFSACFNPKQYQELQQYSQFIDDGESEKRLIENCTACGLEYLDITPSNGNCFFEAVSCQLSSVGLDQITPNELRRRVVNHVKNHPVFQNENEQVDVRDFFEKESLDDWACKMEKDGEFADHLAVLGTARVLEHNLFVITSSPSSSPENCIIEIVGKINFTGNHILLGHIFEYHYQSLKPVSIENEKKVIRYMEGKYTREGNRLTRKFTIEGSDGEDTLKHIKLDPERMEKEEKDYESDEGFDKKCRRCARIFRTEVDFDNHKQTGSCTRRKKIKKIEEDDDDDQEQPTKRYKITVTSQDDTREFEKIILHTNSSIFNTESMTFDLIKMGSLVFLTRVSASTTKNKDKFMDNVDQLMVKLLSKHPTGSDIETSLSVKVEVLDSSDDEDDIFICKRCRNEFDSLALFGDHKKNCRKKSKLKQKRTTEKEDNDQDKDKDSFSRVTEIESRTVTTDNEMEVVISKDGAVSYTASQRQQLAKDNKDFPCDSSSGYETGSGCSTDPSSRSGRHSRRQQGLDTDSEVEILTRLNVISNSQHKAGEGKSNLRGDKRGDSTEKVSSFLEDPPKASITGAAPATNYGHMYGDQSIKRRKSTSAKDRRKRQRSRNSSSSVLEGPELEIDWKWADDEYHYPYYNDENDESFSTGSDDEAELLQSSVSVSESSAEPYQFKKNTTDYFEKSKRILENKTQKSLKDTSMSQHGLQLSDTCLRDLCSFSRARDKKYKNFYKSLIENPAELKRLCHLDPLVRIGRLQIQSSHEAVVVLEEPFDGNEEVNISGRSKCGKAYTDDTVVVKIFPPGQTTHINRLNKNISAQLFGEVIGIIKRNLYEGIKHPVFVCELDKYEYDKAKPICKTIPKLHLLADRKDNENTEQKPFSVDVFSYKEEGKMITFKESMSVSPAVRSQYLFYVAFISWNGLYPLGAIINVHDSTKKFSSSLSILELQYKVPTLYSDETIRCIKSSNIDRAFENNKAGRFDFTNCDGVFTIDPQESKVLDDAVHVRKLPDGDYQVGVHITDISSFIELDSALDEEIYRRGTTFFCCNFGNPHQMIPELLSTRRCSLAPKERKLALSIFFHFDQEFQCIPNDTVFCKSIIMSSYQMSYAEAQAIIQNKKRSKYKDDVLMLYEISKALRQHRLGYGMYFVPTEYEFSDDDENITKYPEAYQLIEEFMILTNHYVAKYLLSKNFTDCIPLRCEDPPQDEKLEEWTKSYPKIADVSLRLQGFPKKINSENKVNIDNCFTSAEYCPDDLKNIENRIVLRCSDILFIQKWLWDSAVDFGQTDPWKAANLLRQEEMHPFQSLAIHDWRDIQNGAEYRCSGSVKEEGSKCKHFGLGMFPYVHFTAPVRRFSDLVVHRLLHAALENASSPYSGQKIYEICKHVNDATKRAKNYQKHCRSLIMAQNLKKRPLVVNGFVDEYNDKGLTFVIPGLNFLNRHCKKIKLSFLGVYERPTFKTDRDKFNSPSGRTYMVLKWSKRIYSANNLMPFPKNPFDGYTPKKKGAYQKLDPHQKTDFKQTQMWIKCLKSVVLESQRLKWSPPSDDLEPGEKLSKSFLQSSQDTENDVNSEIVDRTRKYCKNKEKLMIVEQFCKFSMDFHRGQVVTIQMASEMQKGMLTPYIQLVDLTNGIKFCLDHMKDPVGCLEQFSTTSTKQRYDDSESYKKTWLPIIAMEIAMNVVREGSIVINDLPVTFSGNEGSFLLRSDFCYERNIELSYGFTTISKEKEDENTLVTPSCDYLCIKFTVSSTEHKHKVIKRNTPPSEYHFRVIHAKIKRVSRKKNDTPDEFRVVRFDIIEELQTVLPEKCRCSVELLQKTEIDKRIEIAIQELNKSIPLAKAIALNRGVPTLDEDYRELVSSCKADVEIGLPKNNEQQEKAIKHALTSTFTLIHGPPGTGKTNVGIKLICLFAELNKLNEQRSGVRKKIVYCGPSNKCVDLVAERLLDMKHKDGPRIARLYGSSIENQDFPIPGRVHSSRNTGDSKSNKKLRPISIHYLVRQLGKPHAEEILNLYDKLTTTYVEITKEFGVLQGETNRVVKKSEQKTEKKQFVDLVDLKKYVEILNTATIAELKQYDVIFCTTAMATNAKVISALEGNISQLIIDESGMCTEPESVSTIIATKPEQIVLIGDHKQLQPVVVCPQAKRLGMQRSLFERYKSDANVCPLKVQYRMHPSICEFPSKRFYNRELETDDKTTSYQEKRPLKAWVSPHRRFVFCHVLGEEEILPVKTEDGNEMSRRNMEEVKQVIKIYNYLKNDEKIFGRSGQKQEMTLNIMSQYNDQCAAIKSRLSKKDLEIVNVNTVVSSQGGEWDYVIFSLVRSLPDFRIEKYPTRGWCARNLGFITDAHQINVALTRARKGIFIIGNKTLLRCDEVWAELIQTYDRYGCVFNANAFPPDKVYVSPLKRHKKEKHEVDEEGYQKISTKAKRT